ncbi:hypothetical protein KQX54_002385 [Cotesia glomerata]|uniref:Uncharacterized protein n=1 Tax=Cotesia glomerata TaxID=32391 RepID=A0AAV7HQD0_COTGL|nr:hypothetical protein KQX54_002385 [Cotesia glomerata]
MKNIIILMVLIKVTTVYSCSSKSAPTCEEQKYKNYEERNTILTNLSSSLKMNRIAMIGTRQSMSFLCGNSQNKTQELDIMFQIKHGVRNFEDPIGVNRGKILLATYGRSFEGCAINLGTVCMIENSKATSVAEKWQNIVDFQEKCYLEHSNCFIYDLSVQIDKGIRANSKYRGCAVD